MAAVIGYAAPLQAQEGEAPEATGASGVSIRMDDLVGLITYSIVDRLEVQVSQLDAVATYDVVVSSSNAPALGIGGCGTAAQTATVTGATTQTLEFIVYACGVGAGTVTAAVRRAGAATAEVAVSQGVTVEPIPAWVPDDERPVRGASGAVAQVGTPSFVRNPRFEQVMPTSVVAKWDTPTGDGGAELSGYGLLFWHEDDDHPDYRDDVLVKGLIPREHTYTGLQHDATYKFRIHACNEDEHMVARCGWWTNPPLEVTTELAPNPHRPHTIMFSQISSDSVRVTWSAAANTGGVPLTGFDLRYWPYDPDNPDEESGAIDHPADDGNDRGETLRELAAGTEYALKMRACNGPKDSHCSRWSDDHRFTTTAAVNVPGAVQNLAVDPGDGQLAVRWEAPAAYAGPAVTRYVVQYREEASETRGTGTAIRSPARWLVHLLPPANPTATSTTISGLMNQRSYAVQVRACNGSDDDDCGDWSQASGTPDSPRPRNLDVAPKPGREAVLTWVEVAGATVYQVEAQVLGEAAWHKGRCEGHESSMPGRVAQLECVMDLEAITKVGTAAAIGLQDHPAYALRVRAVEPQESADSVAILIIDTPIVTTMGDSTRLDVTWTAADTMHADLHAGGSYQLRFRKFAGSGHTTVNWDPEGEGYDPTQLTSVLPIGSTSHPIAGLQDHGLYAIQLIYDSPRDPADGEDVGLVRVFAARDAYAWPSSVPAGGGERVGSFPLNRPLENSTYLPAATYEYRLCEDTFPELEIDVEAGKVGWPAFIRHAFGRWWHATDGLVRIVQKPGPCGNYAPQRLVDQAVTDVQRATVAGGRPEPDAQVVRAHIEGFLKRSRYVSVLHTALLEAAIRDSDDELVEIEVLSEVFMFERNDYPMIYDFSRDVTIPFCGSYTVMGCAIARTEHPTRGWITDIALRKDRGFRPSSAYTPEIPVISFNECRVQLTEDQQSFAARYTVLVHELGHAYGIRNGRDGSGQQIHHPNNRSNGIQDTVMEKATTTCGPRPFDVMAMQALYQTKPRPATNGLDELG